ncbi:MAG TPA: hypothetical protein VGE64_12455 [Xanthomonadaceae bacterium]
MPDILLEGYTPDAILALPPGHLDGLVLCDEPLVFRAGTADILGRFKVEDRTLVLELGHIDGGGEGALPAIAAIAQRYATREGLDHIEWRVHAVKCARPNLKLRRVLVRRGFEIRDIDGVGECYWSKRPVS